MFRKLCKDKAAYEPATGKNFSCVLCLRRARLRKTTCLLAVSFLYRIDYSDGRKQKLALAVHFFMALKQNFGMGGGLKYF